MQYDPNSVHSYDLMRAALVWNDENPNIDLNQAHGEDQFWFFCKVLVHRRRLTLMLPVDENENDYSQEWNLLQENCPTWPGFHPDRRSEKWRRYLRLISKNIDRDLKALEQELDNEKPENQNPRSPPP
jgi:hypothetical protein